MAKNQVLDSPTKHISYLRVSSRGQEASGLGIEAQRAKVSSYIANIGGVLVREVIEVESGRDNERPKLTDALRLCRVHNARLVVSRLDRLSRSVSFIAALQDSKARFVIAEMPEATELTIGLLSVLAQHEVALIRTRTREALAAAKARGTKLGGRRDGWNLASVAGEGRKLAIKSIKTNAAEWAADRVVEVDAVRANGATSLRQIAAGLNVRGVAARRGGQWTAAQVRQLLQQQSISLAEPHAL